MSRLLVDMAQRELVADFLRPLDAMFPVARLHGDGPGERARWAELAELGWLGVSLPEAVGGIGLTAVEEALMFEQFGRRLISPRAAATVIAAHVAAANGNDELARHLAAGERSAISAFRSTPTAPLTGIDPEGADLLVLLDSNAIIVAAFDADAQPLAGNSALWSLPLARCRAGQAVAESDDPALVALAQLVIAAQLAGIASATRDMAVDYAKFREQFGQPIGAFQAVKHYCADMAMQALAASELVAFAAVALAGKRDDASFQVLAALNVTLRAARCNAGLNIQVHGGMGFSDECDAQLYLKRMHLLEAVCGPIATVRAALREAQSPF